MDSNNLQSAFGCKLKILRKIRNLTQESLAEKAEISPEYLSKIERGTVSPSFMVITRLAKSLNIEVVELFDFSLLDAPEEIIKRRNKNRDDL